MPLSRPTDFTFRPIPRHPGTGVRGVRIAVGHEAVVNYGQMRAMAAAYLGVQDPQDLTVTGAQVENGEHGAWVYDEPPPPVELETFLIKDQQGPSNVLISNQRKADNWGTVCQVPHYCGRGTQVTTRQAAVDWALEHFKEHR